MGLFLIISQIAKAFKIILHIYLVHIPFSPHNQRYCALAVHLAVGGGVLLHKSTSRDAPRNVDSPENPEAVACVFDSQSGHPSVTVRCFVVQGLGSFRATEHTLHEVLLLAEMSRMTLEDVFHNALFTCAAKCNLSTPSSWSCDSSSSRRPARS